MDSVNEVLHFWNNAKNTSLTSCEIIKQFLDQNYFVLNMFLVKWILVKTHVVLSSRKVESL